MSSILFASMFINVVLDIWRMLCYTYWEMSEKPEFTLAIIIAIFYL